MRTSKVHHIAPSAISITPNANNSHRDLAVYLARDAKIKVYSPNAGIDTDEDTSNYQEWTLTGRNRRLADTTGTVPYTIYAKLSTVNKSAYLVFAAMTPQEGGEYMDAWTEAYSHVTTDGFYVYGKGTDWEEQRFKPNCMFVRLGDVSAAVNGQRTVTLDTGILGTDQYNEEWSQEPDDLPLRVELGCTIDDEDAGPTPYLYWGQSALLTARIVEGWTADASEKVHHWTISRRIGNEDVIVASSDSSSSSSSSSVEGEEWPGDARAALFNSSQTITLFHVSEENDDFISAAGGVFVVTAWGTDTRSVPDSSDSDSSSSDSDSSSSDSTNQTDSSDSSAEETIYVPLGTASINIYVETNTVGTKGDSPLAIFRWYKDGLTPVKPVDTSSAEPVPADHIGDGDAYPSVTWSRTAPNRPQQGEWALWMCTSTRHGDGIIDAWSDPVRISGTKGTPGEDAKDREWIYRRYTEAQTWTAENRPGHAQNTVTGKQYADDDYFPDGWLDSPLGVESNNKFEYAWWRDKSRGVDQSWDVSQGTDGWQGPILWSHYGERGTDGDGVEYVFIRTTMSDAPQISASQTGYESDEYKPDASVASGYVKGTGSSYTSTTDQCTDDPVGVDATWKYEWVAKRTMASPVNGVRSWNPYPSGTGSMALWAKWSDDGTKYQRIYRSLNIYPYPASSQEYPLPSVSTAGWDTTPTAIGSTARYRYMSERTSQDGGITWSAWSTPQVESYFPEDGTSIKISGVVSVVVLGIASSVGSLPSSGVSDGDMAIVDGGSASGLYKYTNGAWARQTDAVFTDMIAIVYDSAVLKKYNGSGWANYATASDGDAYSISGSYMFDGNDITGHLFMWSASAGEWIDLGKFTGEDGSDIEWIYKFDATGYNGSNGQVDPPAAASGSDSNQQQNGWVPYGWYNHAQEVSASSPTLYASYRRKSSGHNQEWSAFQAPIVWSHWGRNGTDGDGVEYVFIRTTMSDAPQISGSQTDYEGDEYKPDASVASGYVKGTGSSDTSTTDQCTDDPVGVNATWKYEWVAKRTMASPVNGVRSWNPYPSGSMALWAKWSDNGASPVVYTLQCTPAAVNFRSDAVGNFFGSYTVYCKVMKTVGDVTSEVTASGGTYDGMYLKHRELGTSGSYNSWAQASSISLNPGDAIESLFVATEFALATDSSMTHVVARTGVPITLDGHIGAMGAAGRMFRPRGTYNDSATYVRNSEFVDLVFFDDGSTNNVNSARGHYYYVSEGKTSNVSGSTHYAPASTDGDGNSYNYQSGFWTLADDFAVVITQAVFAEYAKMGSAIMSGDYMYSAYANKDFVMLSITVSKNGASYTLIENQTALEVKHGVQYNLVVNCKASSSSYFFCRVYYLDSQYDPTESSNWSSHGIEGFHYFSTNSETYGDYALPFMAEYTGWVKLYSYGNGYVSRIAAKNIGNYTNVLPMFINNDAVNLLAYGAATTSSTSQASPGYLFHTPIPVRAGMSYRLDFNARVNTSGATFYIGVYDGNSRLDYVAVNSTTDTAFQIDFTANADGSVYIKGYTTSGSGVVSKLTITPQNPYVPTVAVNWLTGYAHFAGDNVRFNPDGSGKLAAGNITWDNVGNARFNGTLRANLFYSRTKWFDLESNENIIYNINPESEPYTSFGAKVGQQFYGTVSIRLPSAVAYDGIEFDFFSAPIIEDATTIIYVFPTNNDKLYVYRSGYTFMEVTCISPYKDRVKVKAYNGSWFIVEGTPAVTI